MSPEGYVCTKCWIVGACAKDGALNRFFAPEFHRNTVFLPAAFQATAAVLETGKVNDCLLVGAVACRLLEWIFIAPVEAIVLLSIPKLVFLEALAGDRLCCVAPHRVTANAKTSEE